MQLSEGDETDSLYTAPVDIILMLYKCLLEVNRLGASVSVDGAHIFNSLLFSKSTHDP